MKSIKIGIVGAGFAAGFHYEAYLNVNRIEVEVVGIYSRNLAKRIAFAEERNIVAFDSFAAMLEKVDVIDICVPGYAHENYAVIAAEHGKHIIIEKPYTGYYGPPDADATWRGDKADKNEMLMQAMASVKRIADAVNANGIKLMYAENWVYAPAIQKEVEVLRATKGQILWMQGEESHSGSHSPAYGVWREAGGGSVVGKGCHPLSAALYLKRVEAIARGVDAIRPQSVNARVHRLTGIPDYQDEGHLRTDYWDVEDFCQLHITFTDGTVADIFSSEIVMGGVHNWLEIFANNHRYRANINPNDCGTLYNPVEEQLQDVYIAEKLGSKQGWSFPSPNEDWMTGYPQEIQDFMECINGDHEPQSDIMLAADTVAVMYAAYLSDQNDGSTTTVPLESVAQ
jgi:predicted dehydrogenase